MKQPLVSALSLVTLFLVSITAGTAPAPVDAQETAQEQSAPSAQAPSAQAPSGEASPQAAPPAKQAGPMELFIAFSRSQLGAVGFERQQSQIQGHDFVWWQQGDGPPLVLIHGVADQAGTWFQVAAGLTDSYRVLLVDLPGHGESGPSQGPLAMTRVLEGFETWLQHQVAAGPPAILVGNSMGAWIATLVAHRHPERVQRIIVVNGGPLRADTGELNLQPKDREQARRLMAALRDPASLPIPDLVLDDLVRRAVDGHVHRMLMENEDLDSYLLTDRLHEIKVPVDILWGESDRYMGRDYPDRLLNGLPRARLTLIPSCGHLPQAECAGPFATALQEVLASPAPEPSTSDSHPNPKGDTP